MCVLHIRMHLPACVHRCACRFKCMFIRSANAHICTQGCTGIYVHTRTRMCAHGCTDMLAYLHVGGACVPVLLRIHLRVCLCVWYMRSEPYAQTNKIIHQEDNNNPS